MYVADYTTPDDIKIIIDVGAVAAAVTAILLLGMAVWKLAIYFDRKKDSRFVAEVTKVAIPLIKEMIKPLIDTATKPIKPGSNGGYSLTDVHQRLDIIDARLGIPPRNKDDLDDFPDLGGIL